MNINTSIRHLSLVCISIVSFLFTSCSADYTPKPQAYFRFDLPPKSYLTFDSIGFPYQFEYPKYASIVSKSNKGSKDFEQQKYWLDINIDQYQARIYLSYKPLHQNLAIITEDVHHFLYKHTIKADAINEQEFINEPARTYGFLYDLDGDAASSVQFYVTDSIHHFIRGSLYFNSIPNRDSLAPLIQYFREDIQHLMETIRFKE